MYTIHAIDSETGDTIVESYATFDDYIEAREFVDRHEHDDRECGITYVVVQCA